ncbi:hypothetical protein TNCV_1183261 [Trichonephila clavipes]|nr:hypothetical protein TNCV_1183261 [Trichonephila clavipes]
MGYDFLQTNYQIVFLYVDYTWKGYISKTFVFQNKALVDDSWNISLNQKNPEGSELANMVVNDAQMVAKIAKSEAKNDANLALPPRFRQVLIESPL